MVNQIHKDLYHLFHHKLKEISIDLYLNYRSPIISDFYCKQILEISLKNETHDQDHDEDFRSIFYYCLAFSITLDIDSYVGLMQLYTRIFETSRNFDVF